MIKHYLIPAEMKMENGEPLREPKYLMELKVNWAGTYIESKDHFLVVVNESKDLSKFDDIEKNPDVILLDGSSKVKGELKTKLGLSKDIKAKEDEIEVLGKLQEPDFTKDKIWVSD